MLSRDARYLVGIVEGLIAWEWLVSGTNKLLAGDFPQGLGVTLSNGLQNNPNGWYIQFLKTLVIPHSVVYGYAIEYGEILIGLGLLIGAILLFGPVRRKGEPQYRFAIGEMAIASGAALACAFLCINFHFFMGAGLFPGLNPSDPFDEGISLDTLMPPLSLVVLVANIWALCDMAGVPFVELIRAGWSRLRATFSAKHRRSESSPA
jgi:thiosulfate dehydrogenase [quinone] large subunit